MTDGPDPSQGSPTPSWRRRLAGRTGLSSRLLLLTVLFVMVAEVLIYVPSVANFRRSWLNDRLAKAQIAAVVLDAAPAIMEGLVGHLLLQGEDRAA